MAWAIVSSATCDIRTLILLEGIHHVTIDDVPINARSGAVLGKSLISTCLSVGSAAMATRLDCSRFFLIVADSGDATLADGGAAALADSGAAGIADSGAAALADSGAAAVALPPAETFIVATPSEICPTCACQISCGVNSTELRQNRHLYWQLDV